jgi:hypothetical protein
MFGIGKIAWLIQAHKERETWLESLPKEEAEKIREQDLIDEKDSLQHKRALEIAEAGRPRNFWGK